MIRVFAISAALTMGAATMALAQGGAVNAGAPAAPSVGAVPDMHNTGGIGAAAGAKSSTAIPGSTTGVGLDAATGASAAASHMEGEGRATAATSPPSIGTDASAVGMRGTITTAPAGDPPSSYPICRTKGQDRCRVR